MPVAIWPANQGDLMGCGETVGQLGATMEDSEQRDLFVYGNPGCQIVLSDGRGAPSTGELAGCNQP